MPRAFLSLAGLAILGVFAISVKTQAWGDAKPALPQKNEEKKTMIAPSSPQDGNLPPAETRQLLVAFISNEAARDRQSIFEKYHAREIEKLGSTALYLIELPVGAKLKAVQQELAQEPGVKSVEPNIQFRIMKQGTSGGKAQ
jgi:hypothetical protein